MVQPEVIFRIRQGMQTKETERLMKQQEIRRLMKRMAAARLEVISRIQILMQIAIRMQIQEKMSRSRIRRIILVHPIMARVLRTARRKKARNQKQEQISSLQMMIRAVPMRPLMRGMLEAGNLTVDLPTVGHLIVGPSAVGTLQFLRFP